MDPLRFAALQNSGNRIGMISRVAKAILAAMQHFTISSQQATNGQLVTFYFFLSGGMCTAAKNLAGRHSRLHIIMTC